LNIWSKIPIKVRGVFRSKNDNTIIIYCRGLGILVLFKINVKIASPCTENIKVNNIDTVALTTSKFFNPIRLPNVDNKNITIKPLVVPLGNFHRLNSGIS